MLTFRILLDQVKSLSNNQLFLPVDVSYYKNSYNYHSVQNVNKIKKDEGVPIFIMHYKILEHTYFNYYKLLGELEKFSSEQLDIIARARFHKQGDKIINDILVGVDTVILEIKDFI